MKLKKRDWENLILVLVFILSLVLIFFQGPGAIVTGHATEIPTPSNVSIQQYLSIAFCANLSAGIDFGDVSVLPVSDLNASHNYDGVDTGSTYCVNVSNDGNTEVDLCTKANDDLETLGGDVIGLGNETYSNSTATNLSLPSLEDAVSLTLSYVKSGTAIPIGEANYYRFWLDIPAAQPSGDYNNTIYFKGVTTSGSC